MTDQPPSPPAQEESAAPDAPTPPEKKGGASKVILAIVSVLAVGALAVVGVLVVRNVFAADDPTAEVKQGDCLANLPQTAPGEEVEAKGVKVVACDAADAKYAVVGRVDDVTVEQASNDEVCAPYVAAGAQMRYYAIPAGGEGYVLCLKPA